MPNHAIPINNVDIYKYPTNIVKPNVAQLVIGDLHANAMFLLHFLVSHGFVNISEENYERLAAIYQKENTTKGDINTFSNIINGMTINQDVPDILFIGDETCDRGQNDLWILLIFEKLKKSNVDYKILLSNHGVEFLLPFERRGKLIPDNCINHNNQTVSMINLNSLLEKKLFRRNDLNRLVTENYLPNLQLISYSLEQSDITIYSHAAISLETIKALAKKFSVSFNDEDIKTAHDLAAVIDAINLKFSDYVQKNKLHKLISKERDAKSSAIMFTLWNRAYDQLKRPKIWKNFKLNFVHGHDFHEDSHENIFNLDNRSFKGVKNNMGSYDVLACPGKRELRQETTFSAALNKLQNPELSYIQQNQLQKFKPDVQQLIVDKGGKFDIFNRLINTWLGVEYQGQRDYFISQLSSISPGELNDCFEFIRRYGDNIIEMSGQERINTLIKTFPVYVKIPDVEYDENSKIKHIEYRLARMGFGSKQACETVASSLKELDTEIIINKKINNYTRLTRLIPDNFTEELNALTSDDWKFILLHTDASDYMNFINRDLVIDKKIQFVLDYGLRHTVLKKLDNAFQRYTSPKYFFAKWRHHEKGINNAKKFCNDIKESNLSGAEILQEIANFTATGPTHTYSFRTCLKDEFLQHKINAPAP